jgi:hypothetical protein
MSIRNPADALTQAGDYRTATDRMRTGPALGFNVLSVNGTVTLDAPGGDDERCAVLCMARVAKRLRASREDLVTVLMALGLLADPLAGMATSDLGIRKPRRG